VDRTAVHSRVATADRSTRILPVEPPRRGPAAQAQACYAETAASAERSARHHEQRRLAALVRPQPDHRPDKRERRQLDRLRRQQG